MAFLAIAISPAAPKETPDAFVQIGHVGPVASVSFSPDGRILASGSLSRDRVRLWDVLTRRELRKLDAAGAVEFSPDGRLLVARSDDRHVRLWDAATGREVRSLGPHPGLWAAAFSAGGRLLALSDGSAVIGLWDLGTARRIRTFEGHLAEVSDVAFSPDGRVLASSGFDATIRLWEVDTGRELHRLQAHSFLPEGGFIRGVRTGGYCVAFSPDGRIVASGGDDSTIRLWDVATGKNVRTIESRSGDVNSLDFSIDGRLLASGADDKTVKLWDAATGSLLRTLAGHAGPVSSVSFSPYGRSLASGGHDQTVRLWHVATGELLGTLVGHPRLPIHSMAMSRDRRTFATAHGAGPLMIWDAASGQRRGAAGGHEDEVTSLAFTADGRQLASASLDKTVKAWGVPGGEELRTHAGGAGWVNSVSISSDGRILVSADQESRIRVWDRERDALLHVLDAGSGLLGVPVVAVSPDGRTMAAGHSLTGIIDLWDVASGRRLRAWNAHAKESSVSALAFDADGRVLVSGGTDRSVKLWDIASGKELQTLKGHADRINHVALSPDGEWVASASMDGTARVWASASGREVRTLRGYGRNLKFVEFSVDGKALISGSEDGRITYADRATGEEYASLYAFQDGSSITITPSGYYDYSGETAEDHLNVRAGSQVFGIGQYREKFYRPDLVKLALSGVSLDSLPGLEDVLPAPGVEFVDTPASTREEQVTVNLRITDHGGGIGEVRLFLNGSAVVQEGARGGRRRQEGEARSYTVALVPGRNELKAVVLNAAGSMQSAPVTREIMAAFTRRAKPSLHAVIVGIREYRNPDLTLKYPASDAALMADLLRRLAAPLFERADVQVLSTPQETTRAHITQVLAARQKDVRPEDLFVFYVASHGTVDEDTYFMLTSNVGPLSSERLKRDAMSQGELRQLIANIPATKKLIVIDTCNAGALGNSLQAALVTRGLSDATAMKLLARSVGSTVLSASTSTQQAVEGYQGHGLFTYVIGQGLQGHADMDGDGFVTSNEIADYLEDRVPELAEKVFKRAQYPVISRSGQRFPLVKVK